MDIFTSLDISDDERHKSNRIAKPRSQNKLYDTAFGKKSGYVDRKYGPISSVAKKTSRPTSSGSSQNGSSIFNRRWSTRAHGRSSTSSGSSIYSASTIYAESDCTSNDSNATTLAEELSTLSIYSDSESTPWRKEPDETESFENRVIKTFNYDLPCEFDYLNCRARFNPSSFESWISHSMSHFVRQLPPSKASCTLCVAPRKIFESRYGLYHNWRERGCSTSATISRKAPGKKICIEIH